MVSTVAIAMRKVWHAIPTPRHLLLWKCGIDNWRWAGVPFYCRTGKRMAEGLRIISIAFKEAPKSMFPADRGSARPVRTILLLILLTRPKSPSPFSRQATRPGMKLDKLSMQFSTRETDRVGDILEAYERLILDAMRDDHTLFTTADGIESLWERSEPLLRDPQPVRPYSLAPGGRTRFTS